MPDEEAEFLPMADNVETEDDQNAIKNGGLDANGVPLTEVLVDEKSSLQG